jgi:translation elongation factor aEF-1 beta
MGMAAIILKVMPDSPSANLNEIKEKIKHTLEQEHAQNISFQEKEIAFGLKAIMVKLAWHEEKETSLIENSLSKIPHVSSVLIEDYRRAFG